MSSLPPTITSHLLRPIHDELVALLRALTPAQWLLPTSAGQWRVRDVVAHLLDGDLRRLSYHRDALLQPEMAALRGYNDVLAYLNRVNESWVAASSRISPRVLTELVGEIGRQAADFLAALPPHEPAHWPVAWAGEGQSENWMDVSRNYTEYWHHQQQIRDAVAAPPLTAPRWLQPVVALGVRAIPPALRKSVAEEEATIRIQISGPAGGEWWLTRSAGNWLLAESAPVPRPPATASVEIDAEDVARIWYSGRSAHPAEQRARLSGDADLAGAVLRARAVMV